MRQLVIYSLVLVTFSSCTKLHEDIYDKHIKRPQIDIELEHPQWDSIPQINGDLEFEVIR